MLLKNRCQHNSSPLVWVLWAPKCLLTSLAMPTTKQRDRLEEGVRRGERTLLPRLLSPSCGDSSAGGSRPALRAPPGQSRAPAEGQPQPCAGMEHPGQPAEPEARPQADLPRWRQCPALTRACPRSLSRATAQGQRHPHRGEQ